jgi:hypothetical protein
MNVLVIALGMFLIGLGFGSALEKTRQIRKLKRSARDAR